MCGFSDLVVESGSDENDLVMVLGTGKLGGGDDDLRSGCVLELLDFLALQNEVRFISPHSNRVTARNDWARWVVQSAETDFEPFYNLDLNGTGEVIGVCDTGVDEYSCFFYDNDKGSLVTHSSSVYGATYDLSMRKVVQYVDYVNSEDLSAGHGSHVCGTAVGRCYDGQSKYSKYAPYDGVANAAKLAFFDIGDSSGDLTIPSDVESIFGAAFNATSRVHSNSWGYNCDHSDASGCRYRTQDRAIDNFLYHHQDMLILVAAGNDGDYDATDDDGAKYQTGSVGSPARAKNCLSVGMHDLHKTSTDYDITQLTYKSSVGPTEDGRIKPDVTGPGNKLKSAKSQSYGSYSETCKVASKEGTSMATPALAGAAAITRQYFRDGKYADWIADQSDHTCSLYPCSPTNISGVLVKALLINGATALAEWDTTDDQDDDPNNIPLKHPPDYKQGFGRVQLNTVLPLGTTSFDLFVSDRQTISTNATHNLTYHVTDSSVAFQATLTWFDPAASTTATKQLLHDLDLLVVDSEGTVHTPNGNWTNTNTSGRSDPYGTASYDENNNVEKVHIGKPKTGGYTITVSAGVLTEADTQEYALALTAGGYAIDYTTTPSPTTISGSPGPSATPSPAPSSLPTPPPSSYWESNFLQGVTIRDIQYVRANSDDYLSASDPTECFPSAMEGERVNITGIVTADDSHGFYMQVG